jgi:hypothetical protein
MIIDAKCFSNTTPLLYFFISTFVNLGFHNGKKKHVNNIQVMWESAFNGVLT